MYHSLSLVYRRVLLLTYFSNPASTRSGSMSESVRGNPSHEPAETEKPKKKWRQRGSTRKLVAWFARMATRVQAWTGGWKCSRTSRRFQFFSRVTFRAASKSGIGQAQHFYPLSRRTEIATSAWEPRLQGLLAESVLVQSCLERKILVTQYLWITKFSVKDVNLETIIDTLLWYKIWQHTGYNHTHAKQKLLRKRRRACKSSWSRGGNQKSLTLAILQNLANLVKIFPGIITPHRSETHGIAERAVRIVTEGTSGVLLQSGLDEKWWVDSMECYCYLRNITDLLSDGKTPYERRFGKPFKGPIIPFGSSVECYPNDVNTLHHTPIHTNTNNNTQRRHTTPLSTFFSTKYRLTLFQVARGLHRETQTNVSYMLRACSPNKEWATVHALKASQGRVYRESQLQECSLS